MNRYQIDGKTFAVIDGELWIKANSAPVTQPIEAGPAKRAYKTKRRVVKNGRTSRHNLDEYTKARIKEEYKQGKSSADLAEQYGVSNATVYRIVRSVGPIGKAFKSSIPNPTSSKDILSYICVNGHDFKSKLMPGKVICPTCFTDDCDLGTRDGAVKEEER